ncbi:MAG: hypothetical protein V1839_02245 [archaeon]
MREVWLVSSENRPKAEDVLKKDDLVSRQSIFSRAAGALSMSEDGFFIIMDGSEQAIARTDELLKDIAKKYQKKELVLNKFDEIEAATNEAFGFIIGG